MTESVRLLHVEDDPEFAELTAQLLQREDSRLSVETAASVEAGLDRPAEKSFDCIVSDYEMPGRNGLEFLEAVSERNSDVPFILYTGKGNETVASDAISAGVTDYLQKEGGADQYTILANRITNAVSQKMASTIASSAPSVSSRIVVSPHSAHHTRRRTHPSRS
ncbi:hypothetical protein DP107_13115 [Haloglomus irregulare]|jgi:DNA-binding NtrC family response regulator|uniref:Response regulatory domain-containing protein n=1 Tax=Haloglomus irregulare TaxID=2234134 RepID=A0A554MXT0_9EURY|nr:hypothetical protein DP107_13115 [Haloglomus irregulare]